MPTSLVRDHGIESQDPPPDSAFADRYVLDFLDTPDTVMPARRRRSHRSAPVRAAAGLPGVRHR